MCTNYLQLLLERFGLEAFFAEAHQAAKPAQWTTDPNYAWHEFTTLKTTISYLAIPNEMQNRYIYHDNDGAALGGLFSETYAVQSSFVRFPAADDKEKRTKRIQTALRNLRLRPYIHPSQLIEPVCTHAIGPRVGAYQRENDRDKKKQDIKASGNV